MGGGPIRGRSARRSLPHLLSPAVSQERYTCPSLTLHPREPRFLAQTNVTTLALFSAVWPYRMSRRRHEGHKAPSRPVSGLKGVHDHAGKGLQSPRARTLSCPGNL